MNRKDKKSAFEPLFLHIRITSRFFFPHHSISSTIGSSHKASAGISQICR
jgi:hypothetical protein